MKKRITVISNEKEDFDKIFSNSHIICSHFKLINSKLYQSYDDHWIECEFLLEEMQFNEELANFIIKIVYKAHTLVPNIKTSNICESQTYGVKFDGKIEGVVNAIVNKLNYVVPQNYSVFDFISLLLYRINKAHAFNNGNKRTSLISIAFLLREFGYYISWASQPEHYISKWEDFMLKIANLDETIGEDDIISYIKYELIKKIWFKL